MEITKLPNKATIIIKLKYKKNGSPFVDLPEYLLEFYDKIYLTAIWKEVK